MRSDKLSVLFPSVSEANPYHKLLFSGLEKQDINPIPYSKPVFLPLTRAVLKNRDDIDIIHLDWLYYFYVVDDYTPSSIIDTVLAVLRAIFLCIDLLFVKLLGTELIWTIHNKYHHDQYYLRIEWVLNIFVANIVDSITVKCPSARDTISEAYKINSESKISIIPDGNYIDYYENNVSKNEARRSLDIDDEFVYMFFGHIRPYKGIPKLLEQFKSLNDKKCSLWIVGNPDTNGIKKTIQNKIGDDRRLNTRLEFIPDQEVQYYLNAADVLVFPYQDILNSGSIHLGLSFGKPIIAPQIGCIPMTVSSKNTLLYNPIEENSLKDALINARSCDLRSIEHANYQKAKSFDWDDISHEYRCLYESLIYD